MTYSDASVSYKETAIKTATQGQLIVMLYDECVKQLARAIELIQLNNTEKKDPSRFELIGKAITKTEEILTELMVSLDFEQGGEISKNLFSLYTWFNRELVEANINQDVNRIKQVKDMLSELRNTWSKISNQSGGKKGNNEPAGLDISG